MRYFLGVIVVFVVAAVAGCAEWGKSASADKNVAIGPWEKREFKSEIQHPYDLKLEERYSFDPKTETHDFVVYGSDSPHAKPPNRTNARTELRIHDVFTTGPHMFEAEVCVKPGTHACILQIFGAAKRSTTFMLDAQPDGTLSYYDSVDSNYAVIRRNMSDVWFNLKVLYDPQANQGEGIVNVLIDDQLAFATPGHGGKTHYFKCGLYSRDAKSSPDAGRKSEVLFRDITYWARPGTVPETQPATMD